MSKHRVWSFLFVVLAAAAATFIFLAVSARRSETGVPSADGSPAVSDAPTAQVKNELLKKLPAQKLLQNDYHVFQTFNNCAPAALSMALSYFGVNVSQGALAADLRPYNNLKGIDDDKSTPPEELAEKAKEYGLIPYFRAHGTIDRLKQLLAADLPVLVRTLLYPNKDFAHYRVVKGYDDATREFIQDDSFEGGNLRFSYDDFSQIWKPFNYGYLVLVPPEKQALIEAILGKETDPLVAWKNAAQTARWELEVDPADTLAQFNLAVALYYLGEREQSATAFEKVEARLPLRTLWYQIEPIQNYFDLGNYARVFSLSNKIFNDNNRAFSELYLLRGKSYLAQGDTVLARAELEKAVLYNKNSKPAREALNSL